MLYSAQYVSEAACSVVYGMSYLSTGRLEMDLTRECQTSSLSPNGYAVILLKKVYFSANVYNSILQHIQNNRDDMI